VYSNADNCVLSTPLLCLHPQTKGVKSIVSIEPEQAAMWAAVGGAGACVLSCLAVWPIMRKSLRAYDTSREIPKDAAEAGVGEKTKQVQSGIEEDRCAYECHMADWLLTAATAVPHLSYLLLVDFAGVLQLRGARCMLGCCMPA
jgi:hypothetical protein